MHIVKGTIIISVSCVGYCNVFAGYGEAGLGQAHPGPGERCWSVNVCRKLSLTHLVCGRMIGEGHSSGTGGEGHSCASQDWFWKNSCVSIYMYMYVYVCIYMHLVSLC